MRTLSRPMFNMGGPIKQGIMHGIREPKKNGGLSKQFNTGLVGDERYPKTSGREHHVAFLAPILAGMARFAAPAFGRFVTSKIPAMTRLKTLGKGKNLRFVRTKKQPTKFDITGGQGRKRIYEKNIMDKEEFVPYKFWANDPLYKAAVGSSGVAGKVIRGGGRLIKGAATTPTGLLSTGLTAAYFWPDGTKKTTEELIEDNVVRETGVPGGGDKGMKGTGEWFKKEKAAAREAKAKADKEKRINDLLDTMGYDKARKNAAYDALIDAGRMVSERGTLDPKNIGRELIDPIVAATSQRFDKPEQIREAVGLMQVKADIAKQMEDPQVAEQRRLNILTSQKGLNVPFSDQKIIARKTMTGQTAFDTAASSTSDNFRGNIIPNADWVKIKADIKEKSGTIDDITIITKWTNETIKGKDVPDGDYTVGDALVTIQEGQVVNVTR